MLETTFPRFSGTKFNCKWKSVFFRSQWTLKDIPHCPSFLSNAKNASPTLGLQIAEKTWEMLSFLNIYWKIEMSTTSFASMIMSFEAYLTSKLASKNVAFQLLRYPLCLSIGHSSLWKLYQYNRCAKKTAYAIFLSTTWTVRNGISLNLKTSRFGENSQK